MKLKLSILILSLCLINCKNENNKPDELPFNYKYSQESILKCEKMDTKLFQEAVLSFEEDLVNHYTPDRPIKSRAYSLFVSQSLSDKANFANMVSEHSKSVLEALKQQEGLWTTNSDGSKLDYTHPIFNCIAANIKDVPLQKTFSALVQTNSMSLRMIGNELKPKTFGMKDDKYLATYIALELFYGKIYDKDLNAEAEQDSKTIETEVDTSHDGHNH